METREIRLGRLRVEENGALAWTPETETTDPALGRQNPKGTPIDFGPLTTGGGVRLTRDGRTLVITPLPSERGGKFDVAVRPSGLPWPVAEPMQVEALAEDGQVLTRARPAPG